MTFFFALRGSIPRPWGCRVADDTTFGPSGLAALAAEPTSSAAHVAGCVYVGAWCRCGLAGRGAGSTVPFTLTGEGEGREERKPHGCRAAATEDVAAVFEHARRSGDELALV